MKIRATIAVALSVFTLTATADCDKIFSYAEGGAIVTHSSYRAETCDLAMHLDNPLLSGKKVTHIKVMVSPQAQTMNNFKVWLSTSLNLEKDETGKKVNKPDIMSVPCTPNSDGWLDVELPEAYTLTDKGVYVGYSFTITKYDDEGGRPIPYSQNRHPGGFYFHGSSSAVKWMDYEDRMKGVLPIYVSLSGEWPESSLNAIEWGTDYPYAQVNRTYTLPLKVMNLGEHPVTSISYQYTSPEGRGVGHINLTAPIEPDIVNPSLLFLTFEPLTNMRGQQLEIELSKVNGNDNQGLQSSITLPVECRILVPTTRAVLEEATGTWCSACPRGMAAIQALEKQYGSSFIGIAYHGGRDPMNTGCEMPKPFTYFPSATLNRGEIIDPYYGTDHTQREPFAIQPLVEQALAKPSIAAIEVVSEWADATQENINATAKVAFVDDTDGKDYSVVFLLLGNGLSGKSNEWFQVNGLGHSDYDSLDDILKPLAKMGNPITDIEYEDVVLIADAPNAGAALPSVIKSAQPTEVCRSFDLKEAVSAHEAFAGQSLIQDKDKLAIAALLLDKNGKVVNGAKARVGQTSESSIKTSTTSAEIISTCFYDIWGRKTTTPSSGICIRVDTYADGRVEALKIIR